jgi:hypothetical protein
MIDQTHGQRLIDIPVHDRQVRRLGLHLVPQPQREQRVQYKYQTKREYQRRTRQWWLLPAPATQGLSRFAVEQCQTACTILILRMQDLPGTFDDTALFKLFSYTKPAHTVSACCGQSR